MIQDVHLWYVAFEDGADVKVLAVGAEDAMLAAAIYRAHTFALAEQSSGIDGGKHPLLKPSSWRRLIKSLGTSSDAEVQAASLMATDVISSQRLPIP